MKPSDIEKEGRYAEFEKWLHEEFDKARTLESKTIEQVEKTLWLANSGAATVTIGFITTAKVATTLQFVGCAMFVVAIVCLVLMNVVGETNASRDRARRQKASELLLKEDRAISTLGKIRDPWFKRLALAYKALKMSVIVLFVAGCTITLVGVYPYVVGGTHNNAVEQDALPRASHR